jgi:hypothetical protein
MTMTENAKGTSGVRAVLESIRRGVTSALGGNVDKIEHGGAPDTKLQPLRIEFPTFPSREFVAGLKSKFDPQTQPYAKAIADNMPVVSFVFAYQTPRELAEKVSDSVARDAAMKVLQPEFRKTEFAIDSILANRQSAYDELSADKQRQAAMLQSAAETAGHLVEGFVRPASQVMTEIASEQLTKIYQSYGANVDAACVANGKMTYTVVTSTLKISGALAALIATPVTFGVSGVAGALAAADAIASLASAIVQRVSTMELIEQALHQELDALTEAAGGAGQGLKDLVITSLRQGAKAVGFGVDGIRQLVADVVTVGSGGGALGKAIKEKYDFVTITTSDVQSRLELLKSKSGGVMMEANGFLNQLNRYLTQQDQGVGSDAVLKQKIIELIDQVTSLNSRCVSVQESIDQAEERLKAFLEKLGRWETARKFVDLAGAIVSLGQSFDKVGEMAGWEELTKALQPANLLETMNTAIDLKENAEGYKDAMKEAIESVA